MIFINVLLFAFGGDYWAKYELNKHLGRFEDERSRRIGTNARAKSYRLIRYTSPLLFFLGTSAIETFILLLFYTFILFAPVDWQVILGRKL